jgi:copper homeostasis protein
MIELEIIACSVEDAIAAYEGGASRLEVTVDLSQDGLTPPLPMIGEILRQAPIPARIMIREYNAFTLAGPDELEIIKWRVRSFASLGVDGLVVGYIRNGSLDLRALEQILNLSPTMRFTIHNAIERTQDPLQALRALRSFPNVDRALVHGGTDKPLPERVARLRQYKEAFGADRELIIGGGITLDTLGAIRRETDFHVFHLGRAVRTPEEPSGKVDVQKVKTARALLTGEAPRRSAGI